MFSMIPHQYSAGGDPYMVRYVVASSYVKGMRKLLREAGAQFKVMNGSHSF